MSMMKKTKYQNPARQHKILLYNESHAFHCNLATVHKVPLKTPLNILLFLKRTAENRCSLYSF